MNELTRSRVVRAVGWVVFAIVLGSGCGEVGSDPDVDLGVPYRAQDPSSFDCGPAVIQMWRLYDGLGFVSQETIGNWLRSTSCGVNQQSIADGVNDFTYTDDAFWDFDDYTEYEPFFSRQITSIDNRVPVIANLNGGLHVGVINGGKWHELSGGGYQWDYVYLHDPWVTANDYYAADLWQDVTCPTNGECEQIVSYSAAQAWAYNLSTYGDDVEVGGGGGGGSGEPPPV